MDYGLRIMFLITYPLILILILFTLTFYLVIFKEKVSFDDGIWLKKLGRLTLHLYSLILTFYV
jgi:hypothetical protein